MNVAIYMRYSCDNQDSSSIEYQRNNLKEFCKRQEYIIVKEYSDEAVSGQKEERDAFQEMMSDARLKERIFDKIIVFTYSRFSRHPGHVFKYYLELEDLGIELISASEPLLNGTVKYTYLGFVFGSAYTDVKNVSMYAHAGMKAKADKGGFCGGTAPYGYDIVDEKYVINPTEAEAVKLIFKMYLDGRSYKSMADELNRNGYRTKNNGNFRKTSFYDILKQEKYIGTLVWDKRAAKTSTLKRNNSRHKPRSEQSLVAGGCPQIIPEDMFWEVQEELKRGRQGGRLGTGYHHYMLSGLRIMKCPNCGAYYTGLTKTNHGKIKKYYACPNHKYNGCPSKDIRADYIEKFVSAVISINTIKSSTYIALNKSIKKICGNDITINKIRGKEKAINNVMNAIQLSPSSLLAERLDVLEREKAELEAKLSKNTVTIAGDKAGIKEMRRSFARVLRESGDTEIRDLIKMIVQEIVIEEDRVDVVLSA